MDRDIDAQVTLIASWLAGINTVTAEARASAETRVAEAVEQWQEPFTARRPVTEGQLMRAALHESGHCVVATLSGIRVTGACVRTDGTGGFEYNSDASGPLALASLVEVHLAGICAEFVAGFVDDRRVCTLASSPDVLSAACALAELHRRDPDWQLPPRTLAAMSLCTVRANWATIQRMAACLRAVGSLSGDEIRAFCGAAQ